MTDYRAKTALPKYLRVEQERIEKAAKDKGLDFFPIVYELIDHDMMSEIAAKNGFPEVYPHWSRGMEYDRLSKTHEFGLSLIMELVINSNPSYAYLQETNSLTINKTVLCHVVGHSMMFKHNYCFRSTDLDGGQTTDPLNKSADYNPRRGWVDVFANNAARIRNVIDKVGYDRVESFIDQCLSVENLIDMHAPFSGTRKETTRDESVKPVKISKFKVKNEYMEEFINNPQYLEEQKKALEDERAKPKKFPEHAEGDVLGFILKHAPLEDWERDVLEVIYIESQYFAPQRQTKILNEGIASLFESDLMTQKILNADELIEYADSHSRVLATDGRSLNPYKLGIELLRNIRERWNKGQYGKAWDECDDLAEKANWDTKAGLGDQKIQEVLRIYNDGTLIDAFMTPDFCREHKLFSIAWSNRNDRYEIETREFKKVKDKLLFQLTNSGNPFISVEDANYDNRGELLIKHEHQGMDLRQDYAKSVLTSMVRIWKRPVNLQTIVEEKSVMLRYDGKEHTMRQLRS
jgi:stage V sporulation protein R